jgi:hypothetical protein
MKTTVSVMAGFTAILSLFFTSCSTTHQLFIEIQEPAQVTLPINVAHVMIVNNTVAQPGTSGVNRIFDGKQVEGYELSYDSVPWISVESLASYMEDARFFDQVVFYKKSTRNDTEWIAHIPLSKEFRDEIFETYEVDAIISIDRILFYLDANVRSLALSGADTDSTLYALLDNRADATANGSVFLYDRESPLASFSVSDSLFYRSTLYADASTALKYFPESLIKELAYNIGEKLAYSVVPSWTTKERILYTNTNSRIQEALSYSKNGKWNTAGSLWQDEYNKSNKYLQKGKLAHNIAVANEMQDQLEEALQWAIIAQNHFETSHLPTTSIEQIRINTYIPDLRKRIQDNRLLDLQWNNK